MRFDRLTTLLVATLAPTGRTGGFARGPMRHRPIRNADGGGNTSGNTTTQTTGAKADAGNGGGNTGNTGDGERAFSQADVDRIVQRRVAKAEKDNADLKARLDAIEAERTQAAEKTKTEGDAKDNADAAKWKRELERSAKERDDAKALAGKEREARHGLLVDHAVTRALVGVVFVGDDAAELVESRLRAFMKIEQEGDKEVVYLVDGKEEIAATDREKIGAWLRKRWPSQIKAAGGTGANHGRGQGGAAEDISNLTPAQKIARSQKPQ